MAVNVCRRDFGTSVTTGAVSADGHEVENLLGVTDRWGQPKGFVAECFVKPPIDVTFMFPFNLWIQKIVLDSKVGGQMSSAVEIFTASLAMPPCPKSHGQTSRRGKTRISDVDQKPTLRSHSQMLSEKESVVFSSIEKAFSADTNASTFCFVNHSYRSLYPQMGSGDPCQREDKPKVVTRPLRYGRPGALTNVSHVTVRVNRALSGSVALRSVQIWGQPSQFCSKPVVHWFLQVVESIKNPEIKEEGKEIVEAGGKQRGKSQSAALTGCKSSESCPRSVDLPDCPDEFIDPITNEMLVLPLLLPSGHTVDSETLRKHSEAEARWGRPPNDPFTGVPFSKSRQPLPNVKLKERLDRYLLEGGGNVTPPARDVGRSNGTAARKTEVAPASLIRLRTQQNESSTNTEAERLREAQLDKKEESKCLDGSETSSSPFAVQPQLQTETLRSEAKRKSKNDRLGQKLPRKKRPVLGMQHDQEASNCEHRQASPLISSSSPSTQASTSCHEDLLAQSLDAALENALSTLPSFNKKPLQQLGSLTDDANNKWTCSSCHKTLATKDGYHVNGPLNMYSLPCSHLICRDCLLSSSGRTNSQCSVCGIKFLTSEVTKVHV